MKKITLIFCLSILISLQMNAQKCATDEMRAAFFIRHPELKVKFDSINEYNYLHNQNNTKMNYPIVTIPVVFHVIYNKAVEKIPAARINAEIERLNIDFSGLNPDITNTPDGSNGTQNYLQNVAYTNFRFELAKRDPSGNFTTGIVYKKNTKTAYIDLEDQSMKDCDSGGVNGWPPQNYLNIWIINKFNDQTLGYATYAEGLSIEPKNDGIVLLGSVVGGPSSPATLPGYIFGRAAVHEVGHWLNLRHIFEGGCDFNNDYISDTPTQSSPTYGGWIPGTIIDDSCFFIYNNTQSRMWMNYMDYTYDGSKYMFTNGQNARMNSAINNYRADILNSVGLQISTSGCYKLVGLSTYNITTNTATLNWNSETNPIKNYQVAYRKAGTTSWKYLDANSNSLTIANLLPNTNYQWRAISLCTVGDPSCGAYSLSKWSATKSFTTASQLNKGYESADVFPEPQYDEKIESDFENDFELLALLQNQISISPNPCIANFELSNTSGEKINNIAIYNSIGKLVHNLENINQESSTVKVELDNIYPGIYFVQINIANTTVTKKLVKL